MQIAMLNANLPFVPESRVDAGGLLNFFGPQEKFNKPLTIAQIYGSLDPLLIASANRHHLRPIKIGLPAKIEREWVRRVTALRLEIHRTRCVADLLEARYPTGFRCKSVYRKIVITPSARVGDVIGAAPDRPTRPSIDNIE